VADDVRALLLGLEAQTLHRLLGWRPGGRFRHHRGNRLPHDVVIVDETSMVSLSMMARLVESVRADARLVLVGDPGQLTSIEAGAVLGDIVGTTPHDGVVVLDRVHRFDRGGGIAAIAEAVHAGDEEGALAALRAGHGDVTWIADPDAPGALDAVRRRAIDAARAVILAARDGDAGPALHALGAFRLLCAHRRGEHGVSTWLTAIEAGLGDLVEPGRFYPGRPLLVTENDYALSLFNGDTGVIVRVGDEAVAAAFERGGEIVQVRPSRLAAIDTVFAMTVHKSQGSQFDTVAVLLPPPTSQILTRELLYTAVTRARNELLLVGSEATIREAIRRPAARASGLGRRLWGE
jgi:exodeoxyribonuclease V alpha subunit